MFIDDVRMCIRICNMTINTCYRVERVARTGTSERIVVPGSVMYRWAPTLVPFLSVPPMTSTTARARPIPPWNRETPKLYAGKAVSFYLLRHSDSRVATAPPCAWKYREISMPADGLAAKELLFPACYEKRYTFCD